MKARARGRADRIIKHLPKNAITGLDFGCSILFLGCFNNAG